TAPATSAPDGGVVVERAVGKRQGATARYLEAAAKANAAGAADAPGAADGLVAAEAAAADRDGACYALNSPAHSGGDPRIRQARGPRPADRLVVREDAAAHRQDVEVVNRPTQPLGKAGDAVGHRSSQGPIGAESTARDREAAINADGAAVAISEDPTVG